MTIKIYTDGSCLGNGGDDCRGGWGVYIDRGSEKFEFSGAERPTTNNRMELMAVIRGLELVNTPAPIEIHTDSKYVKNGISTWIKGWKKNGWRTATKEPVKNKDLWQRLDKVVAQRNVSWHWVKGHSGAYGNEDADRLATAAAAVA